MRRKQCYIFFWPNNQHPHEFYLGVSLRGAVQKLIKLNILTTEHQSYSKVGNRINWKRNISSSRYIRAIVHRVSGSQMTHLLMWASSSFILGIFFLFVFLFCFFVGIFHQKLRLEERRTGTTLSLCHIHDNVNNDNKTCTFFFIIIILKEHRG